MVVVAGGAGAWLVNCVSFIIACNQCPLTTIKGFPGTSTGARDVTAGISSHPRLGRRRCVALLVAQIRNDVSMNLTTDGGK